MLWAALSVSKPADDQPAARITDGDLTDRKDDAGRLEAAEPNAAIGRESPRHAAGALEKHHQEQSLAELNKAVRDQEDKVEERRKVLATIVKTKGIIYKGSNESAEQSREETIKRSLDAAEYVDAKRDFETDMQLLQEMKLKQIGETIKARQGGN